MQFLDLFLGSFHSTAAYAHMRYERKGLGLAYNFMFVGLTTLIFAIYAMAMMNTTLFAARDGKKPLFDDLVLQVVEQLPEMVVKDGAVTVNAPQPHYIRLHIDSLRGQRIEGTLLTIDTTGATTYQNMRTPMLLNRTELVTRNRGETKIHAIREYADPAEPAINLDRAKIRQFGNDVIDWVHGHLIKLLLILGIALWIGLTLVLYLLRIFMTLVLGVGGLIIGSITKSPIDYATAIRLSALAYTPVAIADGIVLAMSGTGLPTWMLITLGLVMLHAAMGATRRA